MAYKYDGELFWYEKDGRVYEYRASIGDELEEHDYLNPELSDKCFLHREIDSFDFYRELDNGLTVSILRDDFDKVYVNEIPIHIQAQADASALIKYGIVAEPKHDHKPKEEKKVVIYPPNKPDEKRMDDRYSKPTKQDLDESISPSLINNLLSGIEITPAIIEAINLANPNCAPIKL